MFKDWFRPKCPVCQMKISSQFVEDMGQKFCSTACRDQYKEQMQKARHEGGGGCCSSHQ